MLVVGSSHESLNRRKARDIMAALRTSSEVVRDCYAAVRLLPTYLKCCLESGLVKLQPKVTCVWEQTCTTVLLCKIQRKTRAWCFRYRQAARGPSCRWYHLFLPGTGHGRSSHARRLRHSCQCSWHLCQAISHSDCLYHTLAAQQQEREGLCELVFIIPQHSLLMHVNCSTLNDAYPL